MKLDSPAVTYAAQWLAEHALPVFAFLVIVLLLATSAAWLLFGRYGRRQPTSRFSPLSYLVAYLVGGFAVIAGAANVFAELAENLGDGRKLGALDQVFSNALKLNMGRSTLEVFAWLTHLGDPVTLIVLGLVLAVLLAWRRQFLLCSAWVLALVGNGLLNTALKQIFARARPVHTDGLVAASGYSFPSGHSSGAIVTYGMLAYVLVRLMPERWACARLPVVLGAVVLACTVGSSRVFLQVHFASDVLAGFASGAVWLGVCIAGAELVRYRQSRPGQMRSSG